MTKHDDFIKKMKDMNMPSLKKEDVINNILYYLDAELSTNMNSPNPDLMNVSKVDLLIKAIETVYIIAIRSGIPIKEDHHRAIHRDAEIAEWKKMIEGIINVSV
ncbi:hypothetical protein LCGC14_1569810 [marine sediment metagenome]|uniref:Uncharacterized protein n=1 Tax=marine sediment metagenome TaxID=412755 RepID=A0A0F9J6A0_9ZZZZ|nr:hypothetical protein [bacterium]